METPMNDITLTPEQAAPRIASLLAAHASRTLEFKRMGDNKVVRKLLEAICAFANTEGGVLALGVADEKQGKGAARLFGLTEAEFSYILTTFPLVKVPVKIAAQNAYRDVERGLIK